MKHAFVLLLAAGSFLISLSVVWAAGPALAPATDLVATSAADQVKLEWCKPKGVDGTLTYEVYRKSQAGVLVDTDILPANRVGIIGSDGGCLVYIDTAVRSGDTYSYAVIAVDATGTRSPINPPSEGNSPVATVP